MQRVCIARAVACQPEIILFDEAISSLDAHTQIQIMDLLHDLKEKLGLTYIFITHDLTSVTYLCDDVLFLYHGRITEHIPVSRIAEQKMTMPESFWLLLSNSTKGDLKNMRLSDLKAGSNTKQTLLLPVASHYPIEMTVICGSCPGKTLVVTAGVHGCEYVG